MRRHGLTIDSLRAVDVVSPTDGGSVRVPGARPTSSGPMSPRHGDFSIMTRFELQAHQIRPMVLAQVLVYQMDNAHQTYRAHRNLIEQRLRTNRQSSTSSSPRPGADPFPPDLSRGAGSRTSMSPGSASLEDGERVPSHPFTASVPARPSTSSAACRASPLQSMLDATAPRALALLRHSERLPTGLSNDFIDTLVNSFQ